VKLIVVISLVFLCLLSSTELHQLVKLPLLLEHFTEHKSLNNKLSFIQFLTIHYSGDTKKDADDEKDMKLPFKSQDDCINASTFNFSISNFIIEISKPVFVSTQLYKLFKNKFLTTSFLSSIWQPPK
jgi:hypothetical protein